MRTALTVAIILCLISGCSTSGSGKTEFPPDKNPAETGRKVIDDLLSRPDFMMYNAGDVRAVHYAEACAGFGAARLAGFLGDKDRLRKITERYSRVLNENFENTANHVDVNVYGILPLELYRQNKDKKFLDQGLELADGQWKDPLSDGLTKQTRYWIDDIWMIASLQIQAYRVTGRMIYLDRAALETDTYIKKLQQPNGLFHHGEDAPFFWGRGNGWVAAGLAELLTELPEKNPHYQS
ncbi:MAG: glycosyl hydrolase, partial [Bacteroidales bacterium]|nr:glycosyl hydrolase [Bacteroidales bacterium]